jgi:competence protein ComEC
LLIPLACQRIVPPEQSDLNFGVVNVGEGLAQIGWVGDTAMVWDMGPPEGHAEWSRVYSSIGRPYIKILIISHTDLDHRGGLISLDSSVRWSGILMVTALEDTSLLRKSSPIWENRLRFDVVHQGESVDFVNGVSVDCLWPPDSIITDHDSLNRYSFVFTIRYGSEQILVTSDIDTFVLRELGLRYGTSLKSDLLVVPHHGSRGSVDATVYGFIDPSIAVISCSLENDYGFPSPELFGLLMEMGIETKTTYRDGTVVFRNNGYYLTSSGSL